MSYYGTLPARKKNSIVPNDPFASKSSLAGLKDGTVLSRFRRKTADSLSKSELAIDASTGSLAKSNRALGVEEPKDKLLSDSLFRINGPPIWKLLREDNFNEASNRISVGRVYSDPIDSNGNTALHYAALHGDMWFSLYLLRRGCDPNVENNSGCTPLVIAQRWCEGPLEALLRRYGAQDFNSTPATEDPDLDVESRIEFGVYTTRDLYTAAYFGRTYHVQSMLTSDNVESVNDFGQTILMHAAYRGHAELVRILIERTTDLEKVDDYGFTALTWACSGGWIKIVEALLNAGADPEASAREAQPQRKTTPRYGVISPLFAAVYCGSLEIVTLLHKFNVKLGTSLTPTTPVMVAAWTGRDEVLEFLIENGAVVQQPFGKWLRRGAILTHFYLSHCCSIEEGYVKPLATASASSIQDALDVYDVDSNLKMARLAGLGAVEGILASSASSARLLEGNISTVPTKEAQKSAAAESAVGGPRDIEQIYDRARRFYFLASKARAPIKNPYVSQWIASVMNMDHGDYHDEVLDLVANIPFVITEFHFVVLLITYAGIRLVKAILEEQTAQYVTLSAKIANLANDLMDTIEKLHKDWALQSSNPNVLAQTGSGSDAVARVRDWQDIYVTTPVIRERVLKGIKEVRPNGLVSLNKYTKLATGVWPPPEAPMDLLRSIVRLVIALNVVIDMTGTLGVAKVLRFTFEDIARLANLQILGFEELAGTAGAGDMYKRYTRQQKLAAIEEMAESFKQDVNPPLATSEEEMLLQTLIEESERLCDDMVDMREARLEGHSSELPTIANRVHGRVMATIDEIDSNPIVKEISQDVVFTRQRSVFIRDALNHEAGDVIDCCKDLFRRAKLLSGFSPPPDAPGELIKSQILLMRSLKRYLETAMKAIHQEEQRQEEVLKKQKQWQNQSMKSQQVRQLFNILESGDRSATGRNEDDQVELTMEDEKLLVLSKEGLLFDQDAEGGTKYGVLKAGRLKAMVDWLTNHEVDDEEFTKIFLLTHHSFTTSEKLLDLLIRRYREMPPYGLSQRQFDLVIKRKITAIRMRVCLVVKAWIREYIQDFYAAVDGGKGSKKLLTTLKQFLVFRVGEDFPKLAQQLTETFNHVLEGVKKHEKATLGERDQPRGPKPNLAGNKTLEALKSEPMAFLELEPQELARQITIMEFDFFTQIVPKECLNQIWGRVSEASKTKSPNINRMIEFTNKITMWAANAIVSNPVLKNRVKVLKYFVNLALQFKSLPNYNGLTAIVAALKLGAVSRMRKTWAKFESKHASLKSQFDIVADIVSPKAQYANYRKILREGDLPSLPFVGVYLTDLTFIELGNQDYVTDMHLINFEKRRKVAVILDDIAHYQKTRFVLTPVPKIASWLEAIHAVEENEIMTKSLESEPNEYQSDEDDDF